MKTPSKWASRKLWMALAGSAVLLLSTKYPALKEIREEIVALVGIYIGAEALPDAVGARQPALKVGEAETVTQNNTTETDDTPIDMERAG